MQKQAGNNREGFGNVVIEAAAMGAPTVGTQIVGLVDSVADGETGILVPPRDVDALAEALSRMLSDEAFRARMGKAAQERANHLFDAHKDKPVYFGRVPKAASAVFTPNGSKLRFHSKLRKVGHARIYPVLPTGAWASLDDICLGIARPEGQICRHFRRSIVGIRSSRGDRCCFLFCFCRWLQSTRTEHRGFSSLV